jgi:hypothetical protein
MFQLSFFLIGQLSSAYIHYWFLEKSFGSQTVAFGTTFRVTGCYQKVGAQAS